MLPPVTGRSAGLQINCIAHHCPGRTFSSVQATGLQPYRAARLDSWRLSAQQTGKGKPSTSQASSSSSGTRKKDAGPPDSAYPSRSSMSGGWAGGEKGLQAFLEEAGVPDLTKQDKKPAAPSNGKARPRPQVSPEKLPSRNAMSGGFAGGERGVRQFVEKGDIEFQEQGSTQYSPLIVAGTVSVGVSLAAILLNSEVELGEKALGIVPVPNLKSLPPALSNLNLRSLPEPILQLGLIGIALIILTTGSRLLLQAINRGADSAVQAGLNLGRVAIFWVGVFLAFKLVLDTT